MENKVVVLGSCSVCHVYQSPRMPEKGETVIGNESYVIVGGKGSGQAVVARRLGSEVFLLEHLGDDDYGKKERESYQEMGICTDFVFLDSDTSTGTGGIFLDDQGQNKIIIVPGANSNVSRRDVDEMKSIIKDAAILGAQFEIPADTVDYAIRTAAEMGVRTLLDPAPVTAFDESLYPCISIIKPNEYEASELTGIHVTDLDSAKEAGKWFLEKGVKEAAIITMGEKGAVLVTREGVKHLPGIPVKAVDTGGAGDTFAGALLAALSRGWPLEKSICYAQCASAICVTRASTYAMTRQDEIDCLFEETYEKQEEKWRDL